MSKDHNLEEIVTDSTWLKKYLVDISASWIYWTPVMASTEFISGLDSKEVVNSRLIGMALSMVVARPYGLFRGSWSTLWNTNTDSSELRKFVVDTTALFCFQIPLYSLQLYYLNTSLRDGSMAFALGLAMGAGLGRTYGIFQDKWRIAWSTKPVLSKS